MIRNMVNNEIVIYANPSYNAPLTINPKEAYDSAIPSEQAWKITSTSDGYYNISCTLNGITYYMFRPDSGNLQLTTNKNLTGSKWKFHKYTGATFRGWGKVGEWPEHIENGSSATIEAYIYSTVIGENRAWFRLTSVDSDVATVERLQYASQMMITPKYGGNTKIQIEANIGTALFGYHYIMSGWDTGSFFIQNKSSSEYLTMQGGTSGETMRLTGLPSGTGKEYTLWNMVYWSQGYYKIVQDVVGDCMYGNSPTEYDIEGRPWADQTWQQILWKFIPQSDGSYKIQSYYNVANNPDYFVSLDNTTTKNIRSMSGTGNKQLWNITPLQFNVQILYDQAFIDRHSDVGYMNVLTHMFGENSIGYSLEQAMLDQLGMRLKVSYLSTSFQSYPYAQGCQNSSDIDAFCYNHSASSSGYTCGTMGQSTEWSDCKNGLHHKRWDNFDNNLPSSSNYIPMLFTGHRDCSAESDDNTHTHGDANPLGFANRIGGSCVVILNSDSVSSQGDGGARLRLHEIAHILSALDDTDDFPDASSDAYREDCVMGYKRFEASARTNLIVCLHCQAIIKPNKYKFYAH